MLTRLTAKLDSIAEGSIPIAILIPNPTLAIEVLIPAYLAHALEPQIGNPITLHTHLYLEAQGQGTSFIPRLIGFDSISDREFFEVFTTVKGVGSKKALRSMIESPSVISAAIISKDTKALTKLPEIGKRTAETIIAQLTGKVEQFVGDAIFNSTPNQPASFIEHPTLPAPAIEAIAALVALGEQRNNAEQKVQLALTRVDPSADVDTIVNAVFAGA
ncbi:MAG: helix-hairpin-helix domain-containing protein [Phycisphaerales bacterium]|nr:helix-hairpin-helix domain-containing protein [Phycisphaerales bacterium]